MLSRLTAIALLSFIAQSAVFAERLFLINFANQLYTVESTTLAIDSSVAITGLQPGETIRAIDFRPADARLYGVTGDSRLYQINTSNGVATQIGAGVFNVPITSTNFGADFDPVNDVLRLVGSDGQNLRIDPTTGLVNTDISPSGDDPLNFAAGDPFFGMSPSADNIAHTNSFPGAKSTTQYTLLSQFNPDPAQILAIQDPANQGVLHTQGEVQFVDMPFSGFDISGRTGIAYIASGIWVFTIDLETRDIVNLGEPGGISPSSWDGLAVAPVPEPSTWALMVAGFGTIMLLRRRC